eukprot:GHVP01035300.1.p1 GENE.GHVP01035300.1~~GHVP01035300.1.p1  ORF type:complete len:280 (+),score=40.12 GHVP01035300.1:49-840(+)
MDQTICPIYPGWIGQEDPNVAILEDHLLQTSRPAENEQANAMIRNSRPGNPNSTGRCCPYGRSNALNTGTDASTSASASANLSERTLSQLSNIAISTTSIDFNLSTKSSRNYDIIFKNKANAEIFRIEMSRKNLELKTQIFVAKKDGILNFLSYKDFCELCSQVPFSSPLNSILVFSEGKKDVHLRPEPSHNLKPFSNKNGFVYADEVQRRFESKSICFCISRYYPTRSSTSEGYNKKCYFLEITQTQRSLRRIDQNEVLLCA